MEREVFLYVKAKLRNSSFENRRNFGSGEAHFYLRGTYMNDPFWVPLNWEAEFSKKAIQRKCRVEKPVNGRHDLLIDWLSKMYCLMSFGWR